MEFDIEAALQECARSDLVSFDVFDTALLRKVARPNDIFRAMAVQAPRVVGQEIPFFFQYRVNAGSTAGSNGAHGNRPLTLDRIYEELGPASSMTSGQRKALGQLEMTMEKQYTYAHPLILRLYQHALDLNKPVIFLSDMYLPSACIRQILEFHGFVQPQVYVSAEWGGNKGSGKLYQIVREHLRVPAGRCLHFGDNFYADVVRARWNGWRAIHTTGANRRPDSELVQAPSRVRDDSLSGSISTGLTRKSATLRAYRHSDDADAEFWNGFGYEVAGPIYFHYLHWLCRQAHRDKVRRLLLCARDGYPLVRGLEILRKAWGVPIESTYFFASRRLINLATVGELTPEAVEFLLMPNPGLTLRDLVLRLNLDPATHEPALLRRGFGSLGERICHDYFGRFLRPTYRVWLGLWLNDVREELLRRLASERIILEAYFQEVEFDRPDTALVDIGWKATVAHAAHDLVRKRNPAFSLRGYFFGTFAGAARLIDAGGRVESFFMHLGRPLRRQRLIAAHEGMIELLFAAPHGSIVGLDAGPNGKTPVYAKCEYAAEQLAGLERMRQGANRFIEEAALLIPDYLACAPSDACVDRCLSQLLLHPTREQARHLGRMPCRVSYGESDTPRPFAAPSTGPGSRLSSSQIRAYGQAPWKAGFRAQVSRPQACFLTFAFLFSSAYAALKSGTFWKSLKWGLLRK